MLEATAAKISDVRGQEKWDALSIDQKVHFNYDKVCRAFGDAVFDALLEEEQKEVNFFVWNGCCMHKEMNAIKGGNSMMQTYWSTVGAEPPKLLANKDNAAAARLGGVAARQQTKDVSQGGGIKTTCLAGAIFNNKDDKKGQQDTFWWVFKWKLGYIITFPGTSTIHYRSHCEMAGVLAYLPLFIEFLELVQDKIESGMLNHMEKNVFEALHDIPMITELCIMALYVQAISHPYTAGDKTVSMLQGLGLYCLYPMQEKW